MRLHGAESGRFLILFFFRRLSSFLPAPWLATKTMVGSTKVFIIADNVT